MPDIHTQRIPFDPRQKRGSARTTCSERTRNGNHQHVCSRDQRLSKDAVGVQIPSFISLKPPKRNAPSIVPNEATSNVSCSCLDQTETLPAGPLTSTRKSRREAGDDDSAFGPRRFAAVTVTSARVDTHLYCNLTTHAQNIPSATKQTHQPHTSHGPPQTYLSANDEGSFF